MQREKIEGTIINGWEVLAYEGSHEHNSYYWCRCRCCGQIYLRRKDNMLAARSKRCGECAKNHAIYEGEPMKYEIRRHLQKNFREKTYEKYEGHCAYCGREISYKEMEIDFLEPIKTGGEIHLSNLLPSCKRCNRYRKNRSIESFRKSLERIPVVLERDSLSYRIAKQFGIIEEQATSVIFYFERSKSKQNG